jgi:hypothetical protein
MAEPTICARPTCGKPVHDPRWRFCSRGCANKDAEVRQRKDRQRTHSRAKRFRDLLAQLPQKISRDDLVVLCQTIYERGYGAGYQVGRLRYKPTDSAEAKAREAA